MEITSVNNETIKEMKETGEIDKLILSHMGIETIENEQQTLIDRFYKVPIPNDITYEEIEKEPAYPNNLSNGISTFSSGSGGSTYNMEVVEALPINPVVNTIYYVIG